MEKWIPCSWIVYYQYTLDNISHVIQYEYDFVELVLSSIDKTNIYRLSFYNVFSYAITLEHFLCNRYSQKEFELINPNRNANIYQIQNSSYIKSLNQYGIYDLYSELPVSHYIIQTDTHFVDLIVRNSSKIIIFDILHGESSMLNVG